MPRQYLHRARHNSASPSPARCYNFPTVVPHSAFQPALSARCLQLCCKYLPRGRAPIAKRHAARRSLCAATSREHFDACRRPALSRAARVLNNIDAAGAHEKPKPLARPTVLLCAPLLTRALCRAAPDSFGFWGRARFAMPLHALALLALLLCAILPAQPSHDPRDGQARTSRTNERESQSQIEEAKRIGPKKADVLRWRARFRAASRLHGAEAAQSVLPRLP